MPRLSTNGIELEFEECGEGKAPLAVLIAGIGEQMGAVEFPREFAEALPERSFRVVRFDYRDVGLSGVRPRNDSTRRRRTPADPPTGPPLQLARTQPV